MGGGLIRSNEGFDKVLQMGKDKRQKVRVPGTEHLIM